MNQLGDYAVAAVATGIIVACFLIVRHFIRRSEKAEDRHDGEQ